MKNAIRITLVSVLLTAAFISFGFTNAAVDSPANSPKITICHIPPGNHGNCHEITISLNALHAHLDHGDALVCHNENEVAFYDAISDVTGLPVIHSY